MLIIKFQFDMHSSKNIKGTEEGIVYSEFTRDVSQRHTTLSNTVRAHSRSLYREIIDW
jgi:hypothetical protein